MFIKTMHSSITTSMASKVWRAAAWVVGEYSSYLAFMSGDVVSEEQDEEGGYWMDGPEGEDIQCERSGQPLHLKVFAALLSYRCLRFSPSTQSLAVHAAFKVFTRAVQDCRASNQVAKLLSCTRVQLSPFLHVNLLYNDIFAFHVISMHA